MKVLVSGASGLIGTALVAHLQHQGHAVHRLVRRAPQAGSGDIHFDPAVGVVNSEALEGAEAIVHLAGESVAQRWTPEAKRRILDSRVKATTLLCETLAQLDQRPQVLLCASAIGYYGDRGDETVTEDSPPGTGFLADVCQQWEAATLPAGEAGIRVVNLRFGIVLSAAGGALATVLPMFRLGVGGKLGSGRQWFSWITLDDTIGAIHHALSTDLSGPVNIVAPNPVRNSEFTNTLGRVLHRPTIVPTPAAALRLFMGAMADEALLAGARVEPSRLLESDYQFRYADLEPALQHLLHDAA